MRRLFTALVLILMISGCSSTSKTESHKQPPNNSSDTTAILKYIFTVTHGIEEGFAKSLEQGSYTPDEYMLMQQAFSNLDLNRLATLLSPTLDKSMNTADVKQFMIFIKSTAGKNLLTAGESSTSFSGTMDRVRSLPSEQQSKINEFFHASYTKNTLTAMGAPEAVRIVYAFGVESMCNYAMRNNFELYISIIEKGKCQ
ncbi:hypothetical protein [Aquipseudomonas alcaligenes]|uniref:hypothetical protein n=1 Tax=Aquipseudomonas alcaligenes TaxID=43263 RepID=UPI000A4DEC05|nr:hypothetical protein [Pseudomonas alcaligenes]